MADKQESKESEGESWWQSWGKSFVDTVKEKTSQTVELVQKDLSEFYQTIQSDTANIVVDTANKVQDKIQVSQDEDHSAGMTFKQGFSSILSSVSESLKTLTKDEPSYSANEAVDVHSTSVYNRKEMKILAIQVDVGTYCKEPEGTPEEFNNWQENFDFDAKRNEMSDLLVKNQEIRALYSRLVPAVVSHNIFWRRYFYKLHMFELEEARRAALVARADLNNLQDDSYRWDSDDGDDNFDDRLASETCEANENKIDAERKASEQLEDDNCLVDNDIELPKTIGRLSIDQHDTMDNKVEERVTTEDLSSGESHETHKSKDANSKQSHESVASHDVAADEAVTDESETLTRDYQRTMSDNEKDNESSSSSSVEVIQVISSQELSSDQQKKYVERTDSPAEQCHSGSDGTKRVKSTDVGNALIASGTNDISETSSTGSWVSVDDEIRVRRSKKEKVVDGKDSDAKSSKASGSNRNSGSSSSSAVIVEKEECKKSDNDENADEDIDDFDLDEDINDEELQKIMEKIKDKSGDLDDDDDWEDWE